MNNNIKVLFFEWSDINRQPISFENNNQFIDFCNQSNINLTKKNLNFLNNNEIVFATCKVGKNELVMSSDNRNFRKNFSKHRNG